MASFAARSDTGQTRNTNQDACCVEVASTRFGEMLLAVVCDGVGGLSYGDLASATVAHAFVEWFEHDLPRTLDKMGDELDAGLVRDQWDALLFRLNDDIRSYGEAVGKRLGTTFTGLLLCGGSFVVGHVGDCRLYRVAEGFVSQMTTDQTLVAKRMAEGTLSASEARRGSIQNIILQAVGASTKLRPVFGNGSFRSGDAFVLCTDGAYKHVDEKTLQELLARALDAGDDDLADVCMRLIDEGSARGNTDDATVVCVRGDLARSRSESFASGAVGSAREGGGVR